MVRSRNLFYSKTGVLTSIPGNAKVNYAREVGHFPPYGRFMPRRSRRDSALPHRFMMPGKGLEKTGEMSYCYCIRPLFMLQFGRNPARERALRDS